jgi:hypothetical protein
VLREEPDGSDSGMAPKKAKGSSAAERTPPAKKKGTAAASPKAGAAAASPKTAAAAASPKMSAVVLQKNMKSAPFMWESAANRSALRSMEEKRLARLTRAGPKDRVVHGVNVVAPQVSAPETSGWFEAQMSSRPRKRSYTDKFARHPKKLIQEPTRTRKER